MALEDKEESLVIVELPVVVELVLGEVFLELFEFFFLVFVMLDLSEVEEPGALLAFLGLLLFGCVSEGVRVGKKR